MLKDFPRSSQSASLLTSSDVVNRGRRGRSNYGDATPSPKDEPCGATAAAAATLVIGASSRHARRGEKAHKNPEDGGEVCRDSAAMSYSRRCSCDLIHTFVALHRLVTKQSGLSVSFSIPDRKLDSSRGCMSIKRTIRCHAAAKAVRVLNVRQETS